MIEEIKTENEQRQNGYNDILNRIAVLIKTKSIRNKQTLFNGLMEELKESATNINGFKASFIYNAIEEHNERAKSHLNGLGKNLNIKVDLNQKTRIKKLLNNSDALNKVSYRNALIMDLKTLQTEVKPLNPFYTFKGVY